MPIIAKPRDFTQIRLITTDSSGRHWVVYTTPSDGCQIAPPTEAFIRATFFPGGYVVDPISEATSNVTIVGHIKIGGDLPQILVTKGLPKELINLFVYTRGETVKKLNVK
eukprot:TRINITY_DN2232_c0_g1_i2.p2 TRINITY_DN2232_c0_g1~~TRINITY_DN2232_c0_g1_i2.p2  ORF type:complete len:110 (+),score=36.20 TRINITY_DN2232_c0_g1_i2:397-726(+)